jgi:hypothetical protein
VRVREEVDVDGDEDAVVVHVGGALEVRVRGGEPRPAGDEAGVDGHHVHATVHGQRPRRLLRQRLRQGVPQLQETGSVSCIEQVCKVSEATMLLAMFTYLGKKTVAGLNWSVVGIFPMIYHTHSVSICKHLKCLKHF